MPVEPTWRVTFTDGTTLEPIQTFKDVLDAQKKFSETDLTVSDDERVTLRVAWSCYWAAIREGQTTADVPFEDWIATVSDIGVPTREEADGDPLEKSADQ